VRDEAEYKGDSEAVGLGARRCRDAEGVTTLVYGRTEYAEPLVQLGTTQEPEIQRAFPGAWVELLAFPEDCVVWIVRDGQEVEGARDYVRARD
jgi:hypothetical protein